MVWMDLKNLKCNALPPVEEQHQGLFRRGADHPPHCPRAGPERGPRCDVSFGAGIPQIDLCNQNYGRLFWV